MKYYRIKGRRTIKINRTFVSSDKKLTDKYIINIGGDIDKLLKGDFIEEYIEEEGKPFKEPTVLWTSKWNLDPEALKGKHIDVLNILVHERDSSLPEYETEEEAIAKLSQDFDG